MLPSLPTSAQTSEDAVLPEKGCKGSRKALFKDLDGGVLHLEPPVSVFPKSEFEWAQFYSEAGKCWHLLMGVFAKFEPWDPSLSHEMWLSLRSTWGWGHAPVCVIPCQAGCSELCCRSLGWLSVQLCAHQCHSGFLQCHFTQHSYPL